MLFDQQLRQQVMANLAAHEVRAHPIGERRHAAVAVVLLDSDAHLHGGDDGWEDDDTPSREDDLAGIPGVDPDQFTGRVDGTAGGAAVLLTRRGAQLRAHARQWAFPGGRIDPGESALQAACREAQEEVGLALDEGHLLGRLDDYSTRSGYVISPFVFWWAEAIDPVPNPAEVASVHRVALDELRRADSPRFVSIPESEQPVVQVPVGGDLIHAPTGAVLYQLRAVAVDGDSVRVDHLEQPVFAWQ